MLNGKFSSEQLSGRRKTYQKKRKKLSKPPSLQELMKEMESSGGYAALFPEIFKRIKILLALPVGTASVERSFSQMKLIKSRIRSRNSDINLTRLMRIVIEGPDLNSVDFNEILDMYKQHNPCNYLYLS